MTQRPGRYVDIDLAQRGMLRVQPSTTDLVRIRLCEGRTFAEPALVRYGIIRSEWPDVDWDVAESADAAVVSTASPQVRIGRQEAAETTEQLDGPAKRSRRKGRP